MRFWIAAAMAAAMSSAAAQVYRWTDSSGKTHFTDTPPPASAKDVQKRRTAGAAEADEPGNGLEPYALQLARKNHPVKLYSGRDCAACNDARALLNARGVPFSEVSASTPSGFAELRELTGSPLVPTLLVGSFMHKGFDERAYHESLDVAGYPKTGTLPPRNQAEPKPANPSDKPTAEEEVAVRGPYAPRFR